MKIGRLRIVSKRERWGLTGWGWLLILLFFIILGWLSVKNIVPFLSHQNTIEARVMVLEGYIPDYAYDQVLKIFHEKNYELLIATGTVYDQGFYISGLTSNAELVGKSLLALGFDSTKLAIVPASSDIYRDRTYHTGMAVKTYLQKYHPEVKSFNMISMGSHARRSLYLYNLIFDENIKVGNIVIPEMNFDTKHWYKSSYGFRTIINESLGYFYVLWFFAPEQQK